MDKSLIPEVRSSLESTQNLQKENITLQERLEMPSQRRFETNQDNYLETPSEGNSLQHRQRRNSIIFSDKNDENITNDNSHKQFTQLGEDPSLCHLILDSNRDTEHESKTILNENLKKHFYERESKPHKEQKQKASVLNEIRDENNYKNISDKEERAFSLSNKHYKTRLQLQEFRDKYIADKYYDDTSSCTDLSAQKPTSVGQNRSCASNENAFGQIRGCRTIDLQGPKLSEASYIPSQKYININNLPENSERKIISLKQTPSSSKSGKLSSRKTQNAENSNQLHKSYQKPKEERIKIKYLSEERNRSNTRQFQSTMSDFSRSKFDTQSITTTNPFAKNCTTKLNKSLENFQNPNQNHNKNANSVYSTVKKNVYTRKNFTTDFKPKPSYKSIKKPSSDKHPSKYPMKSISKHESRKEFAEKIISDYKISGYKPFAGSIVDSKLAYMNIAKAPQNSESDYKDKENGSSSLYEKIQTRITQKPIFETETSQELELDIGIPSRLQKDREDHKILNHIRCQRCALLEEKLTVLTSQYKNKLTDLTEKHKISMLEKENEFQKSLQQKELDWNKLHLRTKEKCEAKINKMLDFVKQNMTEKRGTRESLPPRIRENPKSVKYFREELLEQVADLKEVRKDLMGENSLLRSKISRLEQKVKCYKEEKYKKVYQEESSSLVISDTASFKKKPKSVDKHSKSVLDKYERIEKNDDEKWQAHKRKIKERILESDNSLSYYNPPDYHEDSEEDRPSYQIGSDSQLYERIRKLEEVILKKKKHKY
ncbi:unnamed protein product [Moneuplotes crassus]|uniref:Uncharacterized protein n=1 Tax=Euplotes crassus TaxID=5936 RepID=A0AAD1Y7D1_EUPCR|nr:unnamed protein product [Moneuplotes crassus]